jgi:hypothetical protein
MGKMMGGGMPGGMPEPTPEQIAALEKQFGGTAPSVRARSLLLPERQAAEAGQARQLAPAEARQGPRCTSTGSMPATSMPWAA